MRRQFALNLLLCGVIGQFASPPQGPRTGAPALRHPTARRVLVVHETLPGARTSVLALALGINRTTLAYHRRRLRKAGIVQRDEAGGHDAAFPSRDSLLGTGRIANVPVGTQSLEEPNAADPLSVVSHNLVFVARAAGGFGVLQPGMTDLFGGAFFRGLRPASCLRYQD